MGFILDTIIGDPYKLPHPIRWIGSFISILEKLCRKIAKSNTMLMILGAILVFIVVFVSGGITLLVLKLASFNKYAYLIVSSVICYYMLAGKSLKTESMKVYKAFENNDTEGARKAVSMIVGRDTQSLTKEGIIKAAVETVAENSSDGVVAPLIYMLIFGPVGGVVYKAVNTMDSMIGYVEEKYFYIGKFAAKLDDVLNYIPARISGILVIISAFILRYDYKNAFRIFKRDRRKHASPNSAQTESAMAGALGVQLAGDATYFGVVHKKPYIGDKKREIENEDIKRANDIMYTMTIICLVVGLVIRSVVMWLK
ncbi:cobalamin biosynthesis protein CobD [Eubacterium sp. CAG:274]|nr:cobalamin biosynthesis protein CobD [Eubacterium sp. CAG:274]